MLVRRGSLEEEAAAGPDAMEKHKAEVWNSSGFREGVISQRLSKSLGSGITLELTSLLTTYLGKLFPSGCSLLYENDNHQFGSARTLK